MATDPAARFREAFKRLKDYYMIAEPGPLIEEAREAALAMIHNAPCPWCEMAGAHGHGDCISLRDSLRGEKG